MQTSNILNNKPIEGIASIDPNTWKDTIDKNPMPMNNDKKRSLDDSEIKKKPSYSASSPLIKGLDLQLSSPPTTSTNQSMDSTPITKIVQPIVQAIMEHKQSLEKSKGLIDQNIADLQANGETEAAEKLKKEQAVAALQLEKEKTTVYDIKAHITLYSDNSNNAIYYKNLTVELFSYDSDKLPVYVDNSIISMFKKKSQSPNTPSPYTYDFNDTNRFTKLTNTTISEYTNKFNLDSIITNLDEASKYDKFNKGWMNTSGTIPFLNPGKVDNLIIDIQFFIKDVNIYAELPKVAFGEPTNIDAKTITTLKKINTLTKPEDINAIIVFGPMKDSLKNVLKDAVLSKLNAHYQHTEVVDSSAEAAQPGFSLFGNQTGGNILSYLLKPKRTRRKTLKSSKKNYKKLSKKVSKKSRKSRK